MKKHSLDLASGPLSPGVLDSMDCVAIITDHSAVDYEMIGRHASLVVDTRNAMDRVNEPSAKIIKA